MTKTETHSNKTILRVLFAAAVVLLFCGAAVGAVGATADRWSAEGVFMPDTNGYDENSVSELCNELNYGSHSGTATYDESSGMLTLTNNVKLGDTLKIGSTDPGNNPIYLNLGGKVLSMNTGVSKSVITIPLGSSLDLQDTYEGSADHYFQIAEPVGDKWTQLKSPWVLSEPPSAEELLAHTIDLEKIDSYDGKYGWAKKNSNDEYDYHYVKVTGGCITGGSADNGGGVYADAGSLIMNGGNIVGNTATTGNGGGVYVDNRGAFTISGGTITGNTATGNGGGVYVKVNNSSFTMYGGTIAGNTATGNGGGVNIDESNKLLLYGGKITGNSATTGNGGGVFVNESITQCQVGRAPVIKDNKAGGNVNNVCLSTATQLQLSAPLTGGEIHITKVGSTPISLGAQFGKTTLSSPCGAGHFVADVAAGAAPFVGSIKTEEEGHSLVWKNADSWEGNVFIPNPNGYETAEDFADALNLSGHENTATYDSTTKTVTLLEDVDLGGTLKLGGDSENPFILDLGGMTLSRNDDSDNFSVITVESGKYLTLGDSVGDGKITGGKAENGGAVYVNGGHVTLESGTITGNTATEMGGAVYVGNDGQNAGSFTITGGIISNNSAPEGGAVYASGYLYVSGTAQVKENKDKDGKANNVCLEKFVYLNLIGPFTGNIRITSVDGTGPAAGETFGSVSDEYTEVTPGDAAGFTSDDGYSFIGELNPGKNLLVWKVKPAEKKSSSSQGSSTWLTETPAPTTPTPTPTAAPTPDVPQVKPVAEQPTGKSPAPFLGVLAGLGAAAAVFGLRRK